MDPNKGLKEKIKESNPWRKYELVISLHKIQVKP